MQIELKKVIKPSVPLIIFYIVLGLVIWTATYAGTFFTKDIGFDEWLAKLTDVKFFYKNIASLGLTFVNAFLLLQLFNRFFFIDTYTFVSVFVFGLLTAVWGISHTLYKTHIALLLFIYALLCFFDMSQKQAPEKSFLGSLLITCASLFVNHLIFVLPACWIGFIVLRGFSFRIFLASILGVLVTCLLYVVVIYVISPTFDWQTLFNLNFSLDFSLQKLPLPTLIYIGSLFVIFFISIVGTYTDFHKRRRNITFMLILLVCFIILVIIQKDFEGTFFPFIALCFSIIVSYVFSTKTTNFYSILFFIFIIINLVFVGYNFLY